MAYISYCLAAVAKRKPSWDLYPYGYSISSGGNAFSGHPWSDSKVEEWERGHVYGEEQNMKLTLQNTTYQAKSF